MLKHIHNLNNIRNGKQLNEPKTRKKKLILTENALNVCLSSKKQILME